MTSSLKKKVCDELDGWIDQLMKFQRLTEGEIKKLCKRVSKRFSLFMCGFVVVVVVAVVVWLVGWLVGWL